MWKQFFWTFLVGPVAALLPERWRRALPLEERVHWGRAGAVSGFVELVAAIIGLGFQYWRIVVPAIGKGTDAALLGTFHVEVTEHQVGGIALFVFAMHPLTWLLVYVFAEGAMRLIGAAFMDDLRGTLPLYLVERVLFLATHPGESKTMAQGVGRNVASIAETVRERAMVARLEDVPDEIQYSKAGTEEFLEIRACRRKEEWEPPKIARVDETYYRLEASSMEKGAARPFRYRLRRLEAGVPGRSVLLYKSSEAIVKR
jgi:hypothetical protein